MKPEYKKFTSTVGRHTLTFVTGKLAEARERPQRVEIIIEDRDVHAQRGPSTVPYQVPQNVRLNAAMTPIFPWYPGTV